MNDSGSQALPGNRMHFRLCLLRGGGVSRAVRSQRGLGTEETESLFFVAVASSRR